MMTISKRAPKHGTLLGVAAIVVRASLATPEVVPASPNGLVLRVVDPYRLMPAGHQTLAGQVTEIFAGIGVAVDWAETSPPTLRKPAHPELLVYLRANPPEEIGLAKNVLGAVLSNRSPQRALFVFVPAVADTVGLKLGGMLEAASERKLVRALAKVIVHEAFHAVAPALAHAKKGLTSANLKRAVLVGAEAEIDPNAAEAFRRELTTLRAGAIARESVRESGAQRALHETQASSLVPP